MGTDESAYYGYFGFSTDLYFLRCKCIILSPSLAAGIYEDGDQIRMGHTLEFRSGGDLSYRFRNNVRIGVGFFIYQMPVLGIEIPAQNK